MQEPHVPESAPQKRSPEGGTVARTTPGREPLERVGRAATPNKNTAPDALHRTGRGVVGTLESADKPPDNTKNLGAQRLHSTRTDKITKMTVT